MTTLENRFVAALDEIDLPDRNLVGPVLSDINSINISTGIGDVGARRRTLFIGPLIGARTRLRWRLALTFALAVLIGATTLALAPARAAVAQWFGIGSTRIEIVPTTIGVDPSTTLPPVAGALSERTREQVASPIPLLGPVSEVRQDLGGGPEAWTSYIWSATDRFPPLHETTAGVVLSVRELGAPLDGKRLFADSDIEWIAIEFLGETASAAWISAEHELVRAAAGEAVRSQRVLLWSDDVLQYRIETNAELDDAMDLAEQIETSEGILRPG